MTPETQKSDWTDLKGKIRTKFGKFNDTEIESLNGHMDQLSSKVQKVYGYATEKAEQECKDFNASLSAKTVS